MAEKENLLRRGHVIMPFGVGAMYEFEKDTLLAADLEYWEGQHCKPIKKDKRFTRSLGVMLLREPPPHLETRKGVRYGASPSRKVPFFRFPQWYVCPRCRTMERVDLHASFRARLICKVCLADEDKTVRLQPTNYVVACRKGHLGDFPYSEYVHSKEEGSLEKCSDPVNKLKLIASPDGDGYYIRCGSCGAQRKFPTGERHEIICKGGRPWLGGQKHNEECNEKVMVIHRNKSNLYFPEVRRSICIPTDKNFKPQKDPLEYRYQEYQILEEGSKEDINCKPQAMNTYGEVVKQWLSAISLVHNMTETRALKGFRRINPEAPLVEIDGAYEYEQNGQTKRLSWLPAYEVCGEGIFVAVHKQKLAEIRKYYDLSSDYLNKYKETQKEVEISEDLFIVHSLSHGLIHALSYKAGYSQSSLRERLYVSREYGMAGVLIYTAEGDQDGTLGGLVELGKPDFFNEAFRYMLETARWCSEDPLCTLSGQKNDSPNRAACHGCLFLPETSCELFNHFLDRTPLMGGG